MKHQVLFSLKNNDKIFLVSSAAVVIDALRLNKSRTRHCYNRQAHSNCSINLKEKINKLTDKNVSTSPKRSSSKLASNNFPNNMYIIQ